MNARTEIAKLYGTFSTNKAKVKVEKTKKFTTEQQSNIYKKLGELDKVRNNYIAYVGERKENIDWAEKIQEIREVFYKIMMKHVQK